MVASTIAAFTTAVGAITGAGAAAGTAATAATAGLGTTASAAIGAAATGAVTGAETSAGIAALEGKSVPKAALHGAEAGGLTGGAGSLVGTATGLSAPVADAIAGGGIAALEHKNVGAGALAGIAQGGGFSPHPAPTSAGAPGGGATSALGQAAPAGVGTGTPDIVSAADASLPGQVGAGAAGGSALSNTSGFGDATKNSPVGKDVGVAAALSPGQSVGGHLDPASFNAGADPAATGLHAPSLPHQIQSGAHQLASAAQAHPVQALEAAAVGAELLHGNQQPKGFAQLQQLAKREAGQGALLEGYLTSGSLPPGLQHGIDAATAASEATIRSQYAQHGMSGSSAEYQDIAATKERAAVQGAQLAVQLFSQGQNETALSTQLYEELMQERMTQDASFASSITNFSTALAAMDQPTVPGAA